MDWQPIETAPSDRYVRLGWWSVYRDDVEWREESGVAYRSRCWGLMPRLRNDANRASHWKELPPPPNNPEPTPVIADDYQEGAG